MPGNIGAEAVKWEIVIREEISHECVLALTSSHPLQQLKITAAPTASQIKEPVKETVLDPLSALAAKQDVSLADPLSSIIQETSEQNHTSMESIEENEQSEDLYDEEGIWSGGEKFIPWAVRKTQIVQTFTTTGTIQMPSFVSSEVVDSLDPQS